MVTLTDKITAVHVVFLSKCVHWITATMNMKQIFAHTRLTSEQIFVNAVLYSVRLHKVTFWQRNCFGCNLID